LEYDSAILQLLENSQPRKKSIYENAVQFFELVHIADLIQQMVHVYFCENIVSIFFPLYLFTNYYSFLFFSLKTLHLVPSFFFNTAFQRMIVDGIFF